MVETTGNLTLLVMLLLAIVFFGAIVAIVWIIKRENRRTQSILIESGRQRQSKNDDEKLLGGRFRKGYELGRGMNAVTYYVEDIHNSGIPLVAKVLLTPDEEPRITPDGFRRHIERFRREMKHLEELKGCKCIIPVHSFYPDAIEPFFVMSRCEGSLESEIKNGTPLEMETILNVLADVCHGLIEIHKRGIIHRDLKPANILKHNGTWVIADFGMSLLGEKGSMVTVPESLPGTIPFTAPEVMYYESGRINCCADIFSLGITMKMMFSGMSAWETPTSNLLQARVPDRMKQEITLFDELIQNMTKLQPEDRPQEMGIVIKEIAEIFENINSTRGNENQLKGVDNLRLLSTHFILPAKA